MDFKGKLRQGMRILGPDDHAYGTVERYDDDAVYAGGKRIPTSAFEALDGDRLYLGQPGLQYFSDGDGQTREAIRLPLAEERLEVGKRQVELGAVEIRKQVETEQVSVPVDLTHEEVRVEKVDVPDRPVTATEGTAFQAGTIHMPLHGQEAVVRKEAVVTGEVAIEKEWLAERATISDTVRREQASVEHDEGAPVHHRGGGVPHRDERAATRRAKEEG